MKGVYICHPISGDVEGNVKKMKAIARELWRKGGNVYPIVPCILPLQEGWGDESNPIDRERGLMIDCEFVKRADEVWLFGDRISEGMWREIFTAFRYRITVRAMTEGTRRDLAAKFP